MPATAEAIRSSLQSVWTGRKMLGLAFHDGSEIEDPAYERQEIELSEPIESDGRWYVQNTSEIQFPPFREGQQRRIEYALIFNERGLLNSVPITPFPVLERLQPWLPVGVIKIRYQEVAD